MESSFSTSAANNTVGGTGAGEANVIANNSYTGIIVRYSRQQ